MSDVNKIGEFSVVLNNPQLSDKKNNIICEQLVVGGMTKVIELFLVVYITTLSNKPSISLSFSISHLSDIPNIPELSYVPKIYH